MQNSIHSKGQEAHKRRFGHCPCRAVPCKRYLGKITIYLHVCKRVGALSPIANHLDILYSTLWAYHGTIDTLKLTLEPETVECKDKIECTILYCYVWLYCIVVGIDDTHATCLACKYIEITRHKNVAID